MAITKATLLTQIASDLSDYGDWDTGTDGFLEVKLLDAIDDVWKAYPWAFRITSTVFATVTGTLGPYPTAGLPADFEDLVNEEKVNKAFAYDQYGVPPPIPDDSLGQRFPIIFDRTLGKIRFLVDPGTGNKTLYYLKLLTTLDAALALFPDQVSLKKILRSRTCHYALVETEEYAAQAKTKWDQSEMLLRKEINSKRRGSSRPDTRTTLDTQGNPGYYSLQAGNGGIE